MIAVQGISIAIVPHSIIIPLVDFRIYYVNRFLEWVTTELMAYRLFLVQTYLSGKVNW